MHKKTVSLLLIVCVALMVPAVAQDEYQKMQRNFFGTFDTVVTVIGYAREEKVFDEVLVQVEAAFQRYHQVFDAYNAYDGVRNLHALNRLAPAGDPVPVEPELLALLAYCKAVQPLTRGKFNVAMGSVLQIWHDYREAGIADPLHAELPPMERLREAASHTDFDDVVLDAENGTVTFLDPQLRLDVGAVAKGWATEQVAQWMLNESAMPSFIISAGGNIRTGNPPLDGRQRWGVSIQDPDGRIFTGANEDTLDTLFVADISVVTSGDYQRYYVVDGKRYHHLIDPDTLMPTDYARSVSILCEDSGLADVLSTVVFLMPYAEGRAFVESLDGVDCYWMLADGSLELTAGALKASKRLGGATSSD